MKQCNLTKGLVIFLTVMITFFCGVVVVPGSWAEDTPSCDCCEGQEFKDCYGFSHDGMMMMMVDGKPGKLPTPMASVGVLHLDENGGLSGHETVQCGTTTFPANISGTYTVNADCTGTASICATPQGITQGMWSDISFVITGDEIQMVTTKMTHCVNNVNTNVDAAIPFNIIGIAKKQCTP